jgi:hypothetical protein
MVKARAIRFGQTAIVFCPATLFTMIDLPPPPPAIVRTVQQPSQPASTTPAPTRTVQPQNAIDEKPTFDARKVHNAPNGGRHRFKWERQASRQSKGFAAMILRILTFDDCCLYASYTFAGELIDVDVLTREEMAQLLS